MRKSFFTAFFCVCKMNGQLGKMVYWNYKNTGRHRTMKDITFSFHGPRSMTGIIQPEHCTLHWQKPIWPILPIYLPGVRS